LRRHATYQYATPVENNGTIAGLNQTKQRHQQRALAAAGAPDNTDLRSMWQLEGYAV